MRRWLLFRAPWRAVFRWLAWPHERLQRAQMLFIFPDLDRKPLKPGPLPDSDAEWFASMLKLGIYREPIPSVDRLPAEVVDESDLIKRGWLHRVLLWLLWPVLCEFAVRYSGFFWEVLIKCDSSEERLRAYASFCIRSEGMKK